METFLPLLGNHNIAVVKVKEEHADGRNVNLQFYLGGDYKVNYISLIQSAHLVSQSISNFFDNVFMYFNSFCFWPWG